MKTLLRIMLLGLFVFMGMSAATVFMGGDPDPFAELVSLSDGELIDVTTEAADCFAATGYDTSGRLTVAFNTHQGTVEMNPLGEAESELHLAFVSTGDSKLSIADALDSCVADLKAAHASDRIAVAAATPVSDAEKSLVEACLTDREVPESVEVVSIVTTRDGEPEMLVEYGPVDKATADLIDGAQGECFKELQARLLDK